MSDLSHLFHVGQKVKWKNTDFDHVGPLFDDGIVTEVYPDHIIVNLTKYDVNMYCEEDFGIDHVYPDYNFNLEEYKEEAER